MARDFRPPGLNRTWAGDITYVWTAEGWLYLAVALNLFSRRVVGWSMAEHIDRHLVLAALGMALTGVVCGGEGELGHSAGRGERGGARPAPVCGAGLRLVPGV
ncbi:hypothetical protein MVI01_41340 [Myxococcus virescens]|uniref:Integrase catalytic domain-containing protein n=1 Tax=Myxococcus virescens TaxID=83456 RepID=A0A511HFM7_9BACT|nr:hypothetical protein MVI01_41340 [Myxococcus virescens]